jgi:phytoene synthase
MALFAVDEAMGSVVRTTTEPMLGQIRLAWWRERLEEIAEGKSAPAEPRLRAVERELKQSEALVPTLAGLTFGWERLFEPFPWSTGIADAIALRGRALFTLGALILEGADRPFESGGDVWALVDTARRCSDTESRDLLLGEAGRLSAGVVGATVPAELRPLTMLTKLALRDLSGTGPFEVEGTRGRAWTMLRHRWTGRL